MNLKYTTFQDQSHPQFQHPFTPYYIPCSLLSKSKSQNLAYHSERYTSEFNGYNLGLVITILLSLCFKYITLPPSQSQYAQSLNY